MHRLRDSRGEASRFHSAGERRNGAKWAIIILNKSARTGTEPGQVTVRPTRDRAQGPQGPRHQAPCSRNPGTPGAARDPGPEGSRRVRAAWRPALQSHAKRRFPPPAPEDKIMLAPGLAITGKPRMEAGDHAPPGTAAAARPCQPCQSVPCRRPLSKGQAPRQRQAPGQRLHHKTLGTIKSKATQASMPRYAATPSVRYPGRGTPLACTPPCISQDLANVLGALFT